MLCATSSITFAFCDNEAPKSSTAMHTLIASDYVYARLPQSIKPVEKSCIAVGSLATPLAAILLMAVGATS